MGVPVAPAVTAAFDDAARKTGGKTKKNERNNEATHGDPFVSGITPPATVLAGGAGAIK